MKRVISVSTVILLILALFCVGAATAASVTQTAQVPKPEIAVSGHVFKGEMFKLTVTPNVETPEKVAFTYLLEVTDPAAGDEPIYSDSLTAVGKDDLFFCIPTVQLTEADSGDFKCKLTVSASGYQPLEMDPCATLSIIGEQDEGGIDVQDGIRPHQDFWITVRTGEVVDEITVIIESMFGGGKIAELGPLPMNGKRVKAVNIGRFHQCTVMNIKVKAGENVLFDNYSVTMSENLTPFTMEYTEAQGPTCTEDGHIAGMDLLRLR